MNQYALELTNVTKKFPDFILDNVDIRVPMGSIVGLVGENGAGKTTTINIILSEIAKDSGEVKIFGKDMLSFAAEIKPQIGVVLDECLFPSIFTVKETERFLSKMYPVWEHKVFQKHIELFNLPCNKQIKNFSNGMKVKLAIAVALSHCPKLLILDEATNGLDPVVRGEVLNLLKDFVKDKERSVLISTHITSDLEKIADSVTFIHRGRVVLSKPQSELARWGIDEILMKCARGEAL
jgi:ABC-2 type transport system ATP-binding protein